MGNEKGMTLIEVMVAMVVFLIGILGIMQLQLGAMRTNSETRHRADANRVLTACAETTAMLTVAELTNNDGKTIADDIDLQVAKWRKAPFVASTPARVNDFGRYRVSRLVTDGEAEETLTVWLCVGWGAVADMDMIYRAVVKTPDMEG